MKSRQGHLQCRGLGGRQGAAGVESLAGWGWALRLLRQLKVFSEIAFLRLNFVAANNTLWLSLFLLLGPIEYYHPHPPYLHLGSYPGFHSRSFKTKTGSRLV